MTIYQQSISFYFPQLIDAHPSIPFSRRGDTIKIVNIFHDGQPPQCNGYDIECLRSRKHTYIRTRIQRVQTTNAVHDTSESAAGYKFELCHTTKRAPALFADWIADINEKFIKHMRFIDYVRTRINSAEAARTSQFGFRNFGWEIKASSACPFRLFNLYCRAAYVWS